MRAAQLIDGPQNRLFLDPVLLGRYPDDVRQHLATVSDLRFLQHGDEEVIRAGIDWLGVNYYTAHLVKAQEGGTGSSSP